ncbi:hypothetical protein ACFL0H_13840 [Thermodesulfobacteriota bacterium]
MIRFTASSCFFRLWLSVKDDINKKGAPVKNDGLFAWGMAQGIRPNQTIKNLSLSL